ncbi:MAG: sigma-70 family RNA polymerase sigma factor [Nibricoccus sp.]
MTSSEHLPPIDTTTSDADLVAATLAGDRRAYGQIVERYQRLLCSLAYSATGQLSLSEDIAQEAFVEGWRQLGTLREPEKLRPWLCSILRFKVSRQRRSDEHDPVHHAEALDAAEKIHATDESAAHLAMQQEERALLWSTLERVPELYREPLILYYREHQSVEHVATSLDLTEDTVKQRLARGRKILQEQMLAFVEGALARSTPGKAFTVAVLAALPNLIAPTTAKAVTVGAGVAAKGGLLAKTTWFASVLASASGVASALLTLRANLDQSRTPRERRAVVKITVGFFVGALGFLILLHGVRSAAFHAWDNRGGWALVAQMLVLSFAIAWPWAITRVMRHMRVLRSAERRAHPELFIHPRDHAGSTAGEYKSVRTLFGVPLIHVRYASPDEGEPPVFAWFAGGDRARGLICAWGAVAIAPISVGSVAVGLVAVGNLSLGLFSFATVAVGWLAIGCASIGVHAGGWLSALGWSTAQGSGFSVARLAAEGPLAFAPHANDAAARALMGAPASPQDQLGLITVLTLAALVPIIAYALGVRKRLGPFSKDNHRRS